MSTVASSVPEAHRAASTSTDINHWAAKWSDHEKSLRRSGSADYWTERAKTFPAAGEHSSYVDDFLRLASVRPGESVLDMGCGTGALALPLATEGHDVVAADFSEGMLDVLRRDAATLPEHGAGKLDIRLMCWEDDWARCDVAPKSVDVAFASRSMAVSDIVDALEKLTATARRRVCVTVHTELAPRSDGAILRAIGVDRAPNESCLETFAILTKLGYHPEVRYISNERIDTFDSADEAFDVLKAMVLWPGSPEETPAGTLDNLRAWIERELIDNPDVGKPGHKRKPQGRLRLKTPRVTSWAFISWDVNKGF